MFRFGVIGMQRPQHPGAAGNPKSSPPDTGRIVMMVVALIVVGGISAGFLVSSGSSKKGAGAQPEAAARQDGPLAALPMTALKVTQVEDPGDPYEDAAAAQAAAGDGAAPPADLAAGAQDPAAAPGVPDVPRVRPPFKENPAALAGVDQGGEIIEPDALYYLMHKVVSVDPAELHRQATELTWSRLQREATEITGKAVRFTGTLARTSIESFPPDPTVNPSLVVNPVWGLVVNSGFKPCHFYAPAMPAHIKSKDTVEIEGYFLKVYQYYNGAGRRSEAPVLVVRTITFVPPWEPAPIVWFGVPLQMAGHTFTWLELLIAGAALFTLPAAFIYGRVERKNYLVFRQQTLERRRGKLAKATGAAAPAPPGSAAAAMMGATTPDPAAAGAPVADTGEAPAGASPPEGVPPDPGVPPDGAPPA